MVLIGQYDSPFVRRVAIALALYGFPYEHRPWSTFGDADQIAVHNPLRRVPTLLLDGGEALIESSAILDYLDEQAGPSRAMMADGGPMRRQMLKVCALATGLNDKAVSLVYESVLHSQASPAWVDRCRAQISSTLAVLEADRGERAGPYWFGSALTHPDVAVACAIRFLREAHSTLFIEERWPALAKHAARCEALPVFQSISQPFLPPR